MNSNQNEKDKRFQNKMHHLQSVIGLHEQSHYALSPAKIREHDRKLLAQQAISFKREQKGLLKRLNKKVLESWVHLAAMFFTHRSKQSLDSSRIQVH